MSDPKDKRDRERDEASDKLAQDPESALQEGPTADPHEVTDFPLDPEAEKPDKERREHPHGTPPGQTPGHDAPGQEKKPQPK